MKPILHAILGTSGVWFNMFTLSSASHSGYPLVAIFFATIGLLCGVALIFFFFCRTTYGPKMLNDKEHEILLAAITIARVENIKSIKRIKQRLVSLFPGSDTAISNAITFWAKHR